MSFHSVEHWAPQESLLRSRSLERAEYFRLTSTRFMFSLGDSTINVPCQLFFSPSCLFLLPANIGSYKYRSISYRQCAWDNSWETSTFAHLAFLSPKSFLLLQFDTITAKKNRKRTTGMNPQKDQEVCGDITQHAQNWQNLCLGRFQSSNAKLRFRCKWRLQWRPRALSSYWDRIHGEMEIWLSSSIGQILHSQAST